MSIADPMMRTCLFALVLLAASPPRGPFVPGRGMGSGMGGGGGVMAGNDGVGGIEFKDGASRNATPFGKSTGGDIEILDPAPTGGSPSEAWTDHGGGVAGSSGMPSFSATGSLETGGTIQLDITNLPADAPVLLVVGASAVWAPLAGGMLVPYPDLVLPAISAGPDGTLSLSATAPDNTPAGLTLYVQAWVLDAGAPFGLSASNAVSVSTP